MTSLGWQLRGTLVGLGTFGVAVRSAVANRAHFVLQMSFMIINDLVWLAFWMLVYSRVDSIHGWSQDDFLALFGTVCAVAAIAFGCGAGVKDTGRMIQTGELDALLTQPTPVLARIVTRRIDAPMVGDLPFGALVFACSDHARSVTGWLTWLAAVVIGSIAMTAFLAAAHSMSFWFGGRQEASQLAANAALVFTMYPLSIFSGALKIVLYTVIPVAFMTSLPARLVIDGDLTLLAQAIAGMLAVCAAAWLAWMAGMRRYLRAS